MRTQRALQNPFGKAEIVIAINNQNKIHAQIHPDKYDEARLILHINGMIGEICSTSNEIYAQIGEENHRELYVFCKDGTGFMLNPLGEQTPFQWE